ncbi:hypothetical protein [Streptomyces sp. NPDC047065]|uniref:hypothetical protein n=1 Tax=Streptomyces sp. NPDC047065 TaxID=3154606 RepID=UPI0033DB809F
MSSLRGEDVSFPNTTGLEELVDWVRPFDKVTAFTTYGSLGLGTWNARTGGDLPGRDLIVVDAAHTRRGG